MTKRRNDNRLDSSLHLRQGPNLKINAYTRLGAFLELSFLTNKHKRRCLLWVWNVNQSRHQNNALKHGSLEVPNRGQLGPASAATYLNVRQAKTGCWQKNSSTPFSRRRASCPRHRL